MTLQGNGEREDERERQRQRDTKAMAGGAKGAWQGAESAIRERSCASTSSREGTSLGAVCLTVLGGTAFGLETSPLDGAPVCHLSGSSDLVSGYCGMSMAAPKGVTVTVQGEAHLA